MDEQLDIVTAFAFCKLPKGHRIAVLAGSGGSGVWIGDPERRRPDPKAIVAYDPATGRLTALRPGLAELVITVNGVTARETISVD
jgi:hypothetical protein